MKKFTTSDWKIEGCSYEHPYIAIKSEGQTICMIGCVGNLEEKKANAMLMANAPKLYVLVEKLASLPDEQCMFEPMIR